MVNDNIETDKIKSLCYKWNISVLEILGIVIRWHSFSVTQYRTLSLPMYCGIIIVRGGLMFF